VTKLRRHIAVLYGGPSSEREVSLRSGAAVAAALAGSYEQVDPVLVEGRRVDLPPGTDCVFIALHGEFGEDGGVQALLEGRGMPYVGSDSRASALAMDKVAAKRCLAAAGVPVLEDWVLARGEPRPAEIPIPAVVKPATSGSSIGVSIARDRAELPGALARALAESDRALIEPYLAAREFTVAVLGGTGLPVVELQPSLEFYDYQAKYTAGMTQYLVPAPIPQAVAQRLQRIGERAHEALGCRHLSRVDILWREPSDRAVVLEVNTIPGFTATSLFPKAAKAAGIEFTELCRRLVEMAVSDAGRG